MVLRFGNGNLMPIQTKTMYASRSQTVAPRFPVPSLSYLLLVDYPELGIRGATFDAARTIESGLRMIAMSASQKRGFVTRAIGAMHFLRWNIAHPFGALLPSPHLSSSHSVTINGNPKQMVRNNLEEWRRIIYKMSARVLGLRRRATLDPPICR